MLMARMIIRASPSIKKELHPQEAASSTAAWASPINGGI